MDTSTPMGHRPGRSWTWLPRRDFHDHRAPELDSRLPALILKIGRYPMHHGGPAMVRSLARTGVRVAAVVEESTTPLALVRHLDEKIVWPTHGTEDPALLVEHLVEIGTRRHERALVVCTDDVAAIVTAEAHDDLEEYFVMPPVPRDLPRTLASKRELHEVSTRLGIPTPRSVFPQTFDEVTGIGDDFPFPAVVKAAIPSMGPRLPAIRHAALVERASDLHAMARGWQEPYEVVVQEYLGNDCFTDWIAQGYCSADSEPAVLFTGRKLISSPPFANATALGVVQSNDTLMEHVAHLCRSIGYAGCFDLDWRQDQRDGTFYLVDFNPRVGANFRIFENDAGIDVVRAMHLDLSGRVVSSGAMVEGDGLLVENLMLAARVSRAWSSTGPVGPANATACGLRPRGAWTFPDDPLPVAALLARQVAASLRSTRARTGTR